MRALLVLLLIGCFPRERYDAPVEPYVRPAEEEWAPHPATGAPAAPATAAVAEPPSPEQGAVEEVARPQGDSPGEVKVLPSENEALFRWRKDRAFTRVYGGCAPARRSKLISAVREPDGFYHLRYVCEDKKPSPVEAGALPVTVQQTPELGDLSPENSRRLAGTYWEIILSYRNSTGAPVDARVECRTEGGGRILNVETRTTRDVKSGEMVMFKVPVEDAGAPADRAVCRLLER